MGGLAGTSWGVGGVVPPKKERGFYQKMGGRGVVQIKLQLFATHCSSLEKDFQLRQLYF